MTESTLLPELIALTAGRTPKAIVLTSGDSKLNYGEDKLPSRAVWLGFQPIRELLGADSGNLFKLLGQFSPYGDAPAS